MNARQEARAELIRQCLLPAQYGAFMHDHEIKSFEVDDGPHFICVITETGRLGDEGTALESGRINTLTLIGEDGRMIAMAVKKSSATATLPVRDAWAAACTLARWVSPPPPKPRQASKGNKRIHK